MEVAVVVVHVEVAEVEIQLLMDAEPDDCRGRDHGPNPANASQGFAFYWGNSYTYDQTFYAWNWTFFHIVDRELGWDNEHLEYETVIDERFCYSEYKFRCYFGTMTKNLREFDEHLMMMLKSSKM